MPKGLGLFGYMSEIREPLRLNDVSGHTNSVWFSENHPPTKPFLGMLIRCRPERLGNIYPTAERGIGLRYQPLYKTEGFQESAGAIIENSKLE